MWTKPLNWIILSYRYDHPKAQNVSFCPELNRNIQGIPMFSIQEVIEIAIQIEKNGESIYRKALQQASNRPICELLQRLVHEEAQHVEWFEKLKERIPSEGVEPKIEEEGKAILLSVLGNEAFSLKEADFSTITETKELLKRAIEFEQDTIVFYEMVRSLIQDEATLGQLNKIIEEEEQHVLLFQKILETGDPDLNRI